ncbi:MAG: zinc ribbon domain-containing protein [Candidatus Muiribacteriota bacterium]
MVDLTKEKIRKKTLISKDSDNNPICQSCGIPIKDENLFSRNTDGSINKDYCKMCYYKGAFRDPDLKIEDVIESAAEIISHSKGMEISKALRIASMTVPRLKRWNIYERINHNMRGLHYLKMVSPSVLSKWKAVSTKLQNFSIELLGQNKLLYSKRIKNSLENLSSQFDLIKTKELEKLDLNEFVSLLEELRILLNICMDKHLFSRKEYVSLSDVIINLEKIIKKSM